MNNETTNDIDQSDNIKLFIVDFWEPYPFSFPDSEHGGVIIVAGRNKDEVYNILNSHFTYHNQDRDPNLTEYQFSNRLRTEVDLACEFELKNPILPGIIELVIT